MVKRKVLVWLDWPEDCFRVETPPRECPDAVVVKSERAFLRELPDATHAIVWNFEKKWFARAPKLRVLATPGAGRELVPAEADLPPGVVKFHGEYHGAIMAETVLACMFAWARGLYAAYGWQTGADRPRKLWPRVDLSPLCRRVAGTRAVVLGYGHVGRAIGARLRANGVAVKGVRRRNFGELPAALADADWLVLALPGDTGTDDVVDAETLALLPPRAVLVNVGRGNAVEERALVRALKRGKLAAAFLDVFKREPLAPDSPLAADGVPNLFRLPHASAFSPDYMDLFFAELKRRGGLA